MKRNIIFLLSVLFFTQFAFAQEEKYMGLTGQPKQIIDSTYTVKKVKGKPVADRFRTAFIYSFDAKGNNTSFKTSGSFGAISSTTYRYKDGVCVYVKSIDWNVVAERTLLEKNGDEEFWEYKKDYDETVVTGSVDDKNKIAFMEKRIIADTIRTTNKNINGETLSEINVFTDKKGLNYEVEKDMYGNVVSQKITTFNKDKLKIKWVFIDHNAEELIYTYKYDEFDEKGNWIRKTDFRNGEPETITKRQIIYSN